MSKIKLGIIGAGFISEKHLEVLSSFDNISIEAISSRTQSKAKKLAKKFNIKFIYKNYLDFFSKLNLDGILILVSAENIYKITKVLLKYKKPLFIEKPIGLNISETEKLINLNKKYKTPTMVGLNRRFYSVFHKGIKKINEKGKLLGMHIEGHEHFWKIKNNLSGKIRNNWIYINSIHTIDLLNFFGGKIIKSYNIVNQYNEKKGDNFISIIKFKSGTLGSYNSFWYSPGGWTVTLFGEGITIKFSPLENGTIITNKFIAKKIIPSKEDVNFKPGFYKQMQYFLKLIKNKKNTWPAISIENVYESVKTAKMISKF